MMVMNCLSRVARGVTWASIALLAVSAQFAFAQQNSIESVNATQQGNRVVVRIQLRTPYTGAPAGFAVNNPARIALDLPGVGNGLGKSALDIDQGDLRSINVVQAGDRTRVVMNLRRSVGYSTGIDGNAIVVTLEAPSAAASSASTVRFADGSSDSGHGLRDIDFRRGREGEGRIVVDLTDNQVGVDIRTQGQTIVVDFMKSSLPENLRRRLDVADFATPVQTVSTFQQGENVRMVIEPKGLWEHNAYQSDSQFVIEVKPVKEDPNKLFQGSRRGYQGSNLGPAD
jgi:type IV pilus assembly protein PilQ